jgi:hypothetical protein
MNHYVDLIADCQELLAYSEKLRQRSQRVLSESTTQTAWLRSAERRLDRALATAQQLMKSLPPRSEQASG